MKSTQNQMTVDEQALAALPPITTTESREQYGLYGPSYMHPMHQQMAVDQEASGLPRHTPFAASPSYAVAEARKQYGVYDLSPMHSMHKQMTINQQASGPIRHAPFTATPSISATGFQGQYAQHQAPQSNHRYAQPPNLQCGQLMGPQYAQQRAPQPNLHLSQRPNQSYGQVMEPSFADLRASAPWRQSLPQSRQLNEPSRFENPHACTNNSIFTTTKRNNDHMSFRTLETELLRMVSSDEEGGCD